MIPVALRVHADTAAVGEGRAFRTRAALVSAASGNESDCGDQGEGLDMSHWGLLAINLLSTYQTTSLVVDATAQWGGRKKLPDDESIVWVL